MNLYEFRLLKAYFSFLKRLHPYTLLCYVSACEQQKYLDQRNYDCTRIV